MAPDPPRVCTDCGATVADVPLRDDSGELQGWLCERCEHQRRRQLMGRRRRLGRWMRRRLSI